MTFLSRLLMSQLVVEGANAAVSAFARACPPPSVNTKKLSERRVEEALSGFYDAVAEIACQHRLGVLRRAALAKAVQGELLRLGYPDELVGKIVSALTIKALVRR